MKKLLTSLPAQLLGTIILAALLNTIVCDTTVRVFFTFSSLIKELLEFVLPLVVFFFVSSGIAAFARNSVTMIIMLLSVVTLSNVITGLYTYSIGINALHGVTCCDAGDLLNSDNLGLSSFFSFNLPSLFRADYAMIAALLLGCLLAFVSIPVLRDFVRQGKRLIESGLSLFFIPILPLYVFGFFLKMMRELPLAQLCSAYGVVFCLSIAMQLVWLVLLYIVVNKGVLSRALSTVVTAMPSYLTALGTMSSVATLPVSVVCAEKNTGNRPLSQFAMPILANIHLVGDAVCTPLFMLATMKLFFGTLPGFMTYLVFVGYLCLNMLAVSGIPGGGIIVMLPLLKSLFGFTPEMLSVMTALYFLQDGFGTAANVMGDGALVILLNRISRFKMHSHEESNKS